VEFCFGIFFRYFLMSSKLRLFRCAMAHLC
jgi:hypothetical protein